MPSRHRSLRISLSVSLLAGVFAALGATASTQPTAQQVELKASASHGLVVRGSAKQVDATGLKPGAPVTLLDREGDAVQTKHADSLGGVVFYKVHPGSGYRIQSGEAPASDPVTVHTDAAKPWDPKIYDQKIPDDGYGYLTTRDGTKLAYAVHPPTVPAGEGTPDVTLPSGLPDYAPPYPTLIEYSGYAYARPSGPVNGIAILANLMGFAVVDVSMRGTGCSSGAYNFFEPLQNLDGYDVIQTIAHQPWVLDHKVGMMGISYGGISQLFTAQLHPPALEAIAPLSVIDASATTLYPGGDLNTGFAVAWAKERQAEAQPAGPGQGQPYAWDQIKNGDMTCAANQALHGNAEDLLAQVKKNSHYRPKIADPLDPVTFVHKIHVPVFMACQFEDEQTGGHCPTLAQHMTGTNQKWFTFTNGAHIDSLDPATYDRWYDFLELYVAHQAPMENAAVTAAASPAIYQGAMGLPQQDLVTMPPDPIQRIPSYAEALKQFKQLPEIRVLFDNGAGHSPVGQQVAGNPYAGFERSFSQWPIPTTVAQTWYLNTRGTMTHSRPNGSETDWYTSDASALPLTDFKGGTGGGGLWGDAEQWSWNWKPNPAGTAVSYESAPLKRDTAVIGAGAVRLWVRSSTPDVDLQATISEIAPNGNETFVQNGYMRGSERKIQHSGHTIMAAPSTPLAPIPNERASSVRPMPEGKFVKVVIPLYYEGHVYRAGTRIRLTIAAPNGAQPVWSFSKPVPKGKSQVEIAFSHRRPSSVLLPVVPGVSAPTVQPPCPALRNEPCRPYAPIVNYTENR